MSNLETNRKHSSLTMNINNQRILSLSRLCFDVEDIEFVENKLILC